MRTIACAGTSFYCKENTKVGQKRSRDRGVFCSRETEQESTQLRWLPSLISGDLAFMRVESFSSSDTGR